PRLFLAGRRERDVGAPRVLPAGAPLGLAVPQEHELRVARGLEGGRLSRHGTSILRPAATRTSARRRPWNYLRNITGLPFSVGWSHAILCSCLSSTTVSPRPHCPAPPPPAQEPAPAPGPPPTSSS